MLVSTVQQSESARRVFYLVPKKAGGSVKTGHCFNQKGLPPQINGKGMIPKKTKTAPASEIQIGGGEWTPSCTSARKLRICRNT